MSQPLDTGARSAPSDTADHPRPLAARPSQALSGRLVVPGDKSMSHRALMLAALAVGESRITGLLEGEDVLSTAQAMRALGAAVERTGEGAWRVHGRGVGTLAEPAGILDFGNAGTGARLAMGLLAGQPFTSFLTGDASLCRRPMGRVIAPLQQMGARFASRSGQRLPLALTGSDDLLPIRYLLPVASAQVKSAVLLAGLHAPGVTTVIEPVPTRDHTETMLRHFGAQLSITEGREGREIALTGQPELTGREVAVPADPSSAAFPLVAALILPGSRVTLPAVALNPQRAGLIVTLREMGATIREENAGTQAGEPVADLVVEASRLQGVEVPAARAASMIDEYPALCIAAAFAKGATRMTGLAELRVKESDRLSAMAHGLAACGVEVEEGEDWLVVQGRGGTRPRGGGMIEADLDHRIAMAFAVLGLASERPVTIDDARPIDTSFPGFVGLMRALGADLEMEGERWA